MKLTVSKSYVDKEGRVMAVTMPMPKVPTRIYPRSQYMKAGREYDKAVARILQMVEHYIVEPDTMVVESPEQSDWDTVLTDAIVETQGSIKPYSRMLKYLNDNYTITKKP